MFNFRYIQYKFVAVLKYMIELNAAVGILTPIVAICAENECGRLKQ